MKQPLCERLAGGNERTLGDTETIVRETLEQPVLLAELVGCLNTPGDLVRTRAANALKKIVAARPGALQPFAKPILRAALSQNPLPAQWNLTLVLGQLELHGRDRAVVIDLLLDGLAGRSAFLRTCCMQALTDLALRDLDLRKRIIPILKECTLNGSAAMRARGRKLLKRMGIEGAKSGPPGARR